MADMLGTLFSFELLVDFIRMNKLAAGERRLKLAVGVRLLDFPTLLIYPKDGGGSQDDSDNEKENLSAGDVKQQPQSGTSEYNFQRGKSCLFKTRLDSLHGHLCNTPLYAMVLDLGSELPKFVGGSLIPLRKLTDMIKADVKENGISTPSAHGERGLFAICNLMGVKIGCISLGYKLVSLGASLVPRIPENQICEGGSARVRRKQATNSFAGTAESEENNDGDGAALKPPVNECSVLCQEFELEGKTADGVVSKTDSAKSTGTQTEHPKTKVKPVAYRYDQIIFESETNPAILCPPPLYYSHPVKTEEQCDSNHYGSGNIRMEVLAEENNSENENGDRIQTVTCCSEGEPTNNTLTQQTHTTTTGLAGVLRQMPLLNALLAELSQLYIQQSPINPSLAWLCQPKPEEPCGAAANEGSRPNGTDASVSPTAGVKRSPGHSIRHGRCLVCSAVSLSAGPQKTKRADRRSSEHRKTPKQSPPKRKLMYGLTNTLRLRLQQTNPEVLREQERREQRHKEQVEKLKCMNDKPRSQTGPDSGQKPPGIKIGDAINRGINVDENSETISSRAIGGPQVDSVPSRTGSSSSKLNKNAESRSWFCSSPPLGAVSNGNLKTKMLISHQNKAVQVHIPSVLRQPSKASHKEESRSSTSQPSRLANPKVHGASLADNVSLVPSPVQRDSDSDSSCPKPVEYLDDFNSLEPSEGYSLELLSSPDPVLDNDRQEASMDHVNSDKDSQSCRGTAFPIPIKADTSPKRPLKGTHVIRPSTEGSPVSLSSDDDENRPASTRSSWLRHQKEFQAPSPAAEELSDSDTLRRTGSRLVSCSRDTPSIVDFSLPADDSESIGSSDRKVTAKDPENEEMGDELGSLGFDNKYHHVSELVVNELPGYTL